MLHNAPSNLDENVLKSVSNLCEMSLINMAVLIHPMDQGVLEITKELYRRSLLQMGMVNDFTIFCHMAKAITKGKIKL